MPTRLEDFASLKPDAQRSKEEESANEVKTKLPAYIGTKIVNAIPMDECTFLTRFKGQDTTNRETQLGYLVKYEDGYDSWSPKEVFERSYRLITGAEKRLI